MNSEENGIQPGSEPDGVQFARTPGRDIFGPLDDHLPEVRIPADVKVAAMRAAAMAGLDLTAWVRELVYASLYSPAHLASLYEKRALRVLGNAGQEGADASQARGA